MDDPAQALAYARADFSEPHNRFIELFSDLIGGRPSGAVLDLGCGAGDICRRFAAAFPDCTVQGVDGAEAMLELAQADTRDLGLDTRIRYLLARLPEAPLPERHYDAVISNSLLHHLHDPAVLWDSVIRFGRPGASVFVMDLRRPISPGTAQRLVDDHAREEPAILRTDFYNSLLAAYRPDEVEKQLEYQGLERRLRVEVVSDRHLIVFGRL
jgi:ubiquinone/menaquinone biosynthesis C-methylase UbiE